MKASGGRWGKPRRMAQGGGGNEQAVRILDDELLRLTLSRPDLGLLR